MSIFGARVISNSFLRRVISTDFLASSNRFIRSAAVYHSKYQSSCKMSSESTKNIKYLTQNEAIEIDQQLFNEYAFSVDQLMELAGLSCANAVTDSFPKGNVLVVVGPGNNGGDGFVCARHLKLFGYTPSVLYAKPSNTDLMKRLQTQVTKMGIDFVSVDSVTNNPSDISKNYSLIIDAMFGFSFKPPLRAPFDAIIDAVVKSNVPVFCIDIPSGWHVEKGPSPGECSSDASERIIKPSALISLTAPKLCAQHIPKGCVHYLGGRFVPQSLADQHLLNLPPYPSTNCFLKLSS
ncbi:unnamed protein product [Anisakis simplex]|uniref:NAD(P)H-hydrate epimerase n=1 Tax=Anisakis simplex TaxID=6269 RepID=A0A0M3JRD2_ANISI|nr:unnamed protein product [Anisakis simplex]